MRGPVWLVEPGAIAEIIGLASDSPHGAQVPHHVRIGGELRHHWHGGDASGQSEKSKWNESETEVHRCDSLVDDGLSCGGFSPSKDQ
jgi:hypothetical protein